MNSYLTNLPKDKSLAKEVIINNNEIEKLRLERGILSKFWGTSEKISHNIAALTISILLLFGVAFSFCCMHTPADQISISIKDLWSILIPMITLAIGYLFGDHKKRE